MTYVSDFRWHPNFFSPSDREEGKASISKENCKPTLWSSSQIVAKNFGVRSMRMGDGIFCLNLEGGMMRISHTQVSLISHAQILLRTDCWKLAKNQGRNVGGSVHGRVREASIDGAKLSKFQNCCKNTSEEVWEEQTYHGSSWSDESKLFEI